MKNAEHVNQLTTSMENFKAAYNVLLHEIRMYEQLNKTSINDLPGFTKSYPFDKSFDELAINEWVDCVTESVSKMNFKVLNYEYLNTGGNCMVGISEVWLPELKQTVYAYTNEEGCTISAVDYIRNEVLLDDYDEVIIDTIDWGRATGNEKYFELYRDCMDRYLKDDCKYFKVSRGVPYHLLSYELQKTVDADYLKWLESDGDGLVETDGYKTFVDEYYTPATDEEQLLQAIKDFKQWHTTTAGEEEYYNEEYILTFAGNTVKLPFMADVWDAVDTMLKTVIENW